MDRQSGSKPTNCISMYVVHAKVKLNFIPGTCEESNNAYRHLVSEPLSRAAAEKTLAEWKLSVESPGWSFWIEEVED